ncbi:MAG TPA: hypothetical protein PLH92_17040 [Mycobacterium sp.]|nr:hypothetical protein [Mycobacterium sp.]
MTRVQADVIPSVKDWLSTRIEDAEVRLNVPERWIPANGAILVVADDGGPTLWPIKSQHTIRLTSYAAGRTAARAIVVLAAGLLGDGRPTGIAHVDPEMGSVLDARDTETGAFMASVLLTVQAKTVEV